jgi:uncharacterized membrane protein
MTDAELQMNHLGESSMNRLLAHLKRKFLAGLFVLVPLAITIFALSFLFSLADGILGPHLERLISVITEGKTSYVPGLGMLAGILVIYITGLLVSNMLGRTLLHGWDWLLGRIPLVKSIYTGSKQLIDVFREGKNSYRRAVFVEWPRKGVLAVGFVTAEIVQGGEPYLVVYVPTMPNPTSGFALFFRAEEVLDSGMSVEEAVKFVVSGGVVLPTTK